MGMKSPSALDIQDAVELLRAQPRSAQQGAYARMAHWLERYQVEIEDRRNARNAGVTVSYYKKQLKHFRKVPPRRV